MGDENVLLCMRDGKWQLGTLGLLRKGSSIYPINVLHTKVIKFVWIRLFQHLNFYIIILKLIMTHKKVVGYWESH